MSNENNVWVDSLWTTRKECISIKVGDDVLTREISVGMSVKSDNRTPSSVLHDKLNQALTKLIEDEKDAWLTAELLKQEQVHLKDSVEGMNDLVNGKYSIVQPVNKSAATPRQANSLML
jgi:hypothetical protein